ncbi:unnamed protein product, partial [Rotaria sordida]
MRDGATCDLPAHGWGSHDSDDSEFRTDILFYDRGGGRDHDHL